MMAVDADETRSEDVFPRPSVPLRDEDTVHHSLIFISDQLALPFARTVEDQRCRVAVVGLFRFRAGEGGIHQDLLSVAFDVSPAEAVGSGEAVNLFYIPGLARIAVVREDGNYAD